MKKFFYIFAIMFITILNVNATEIKYCGVGAEIIKDPYNKKTFVLTTLANSSAKEMNVPIGGEIISINNKKTKSLSIEKIGEMLTGDEGTTVNVLIKYNKKSINYELTRKIINTKQEDDRLFDIHWKQVVPASFEKTKYFPSIISKKVSKKYLYQVVLPVNYWADRKLRFKIGYDACLEYPKIDQSSCLMNLVNREIAKTENDRQIEIQQEIAYQQAKQNYINAMRGIQTNNNLNNINNSIQQQNIYLQNINNSLRNW